MEKELNITPNPPSPAPVVGHSFQLCLLHILRFQTAKAIVKTRTAGRKLRMNSQNWLRANVPPVNRSYI